MEKNQEVFIPEYLKEKLEVLQKKGKYPDLQTFVLSILNNYVSDNKYDSDVTEEEEEKVKDKLKKLGYLS